MGFQSIASNVNLFISLIRFQGISVYVTQNVEPSPSSMKEIIQCAGGQVLLGFSCGKNRTDQIWNQLTASFLDFSRLARAQAAHEHTEHATTQLGRVSFVDAIIIVTVTK